MPCNRVTNAAGCGVFSPSEHLIAVVTGVAGRSSHFRWLIDTRTWLSAITVINVVIVDILNSIVLSSIIISLLLLLLLLSVISQFLTAVRRLHL